MALGLVGGNGNCDLDHRTGNESDKGSGLGSGKSNGRKVRSSAHLIGGFVGGLTSAVALQPLDLLKTRIQQQPKGSIGGLAKGSPLTSVVLQIIKENPLSLWRGTIPSMLRTSIGSALYLSCLNQMRTKIAEITANKTGQPIRVTKSSKLPELSMGLNLTTGALSRGIVGYITMPITIIKVRYESTFYNYNSMMEAVKDIYKTDKINGFFKGFGATCLRDAPYAGLYVLLYEKAKVITPWLLPRSFISFKDKDTRTNYTIGTSTLINTLSAFTAAGIATTITAPFDTIKTRMQLQPSKFSNFFVTLQHIIKKEEFFGLFSGLSMRLTRKAFSAGIAWGIYEELIKRFM